jgi:hypothetical protein
MVGIESTGEEMKRELDRCQQALSEFLEEKREKFPRFYFIGDDDLLEVCTYTYIYTHIYICMYVCTCVYIALIDK